MVSSIFLAKVLGLYFAIVGISVLLNRVFFSQAVDNLLANPGIQVFSAAHILLCGILLVVLHNHWVADWTIAITVIAWWILLNGTVRLWFPLFFAERVKRLRQFSVWPIFGIIILVGGLLLLYQGFLGTEALGMIDGQPGQ